MRIIIISIIIIGISIGSIILFNKNNKNKEPIYKETQIETQIEEYIRDNGKEYSKDIISGENSFYVGGIGKSIGSYNIEKFKPEDFDIKGLMDSVPDTCNKFGAEININDEEIIVNLYTEKDKFYEKVEE